MSEAKTYPELGLILVDVSFDYSFIIRRQDGTEINGVPMQTSLFQGGFEAFLPQTFPDRTVLDSDPWRRSLVEDIISYWSNGQPHSFDVNRPTLGSLSYYPLKMVAAEWMTYLEVIYHSTKQYEYVPTTKTPPMEQLATLYNDLSALQKWSRRNIS